MPAVTRRAARISCAVMASRTERVMAQTVSSVVESGSAPSAGTSRAVFLKPTMPFSAAGMRIEPPVSEPSPMNAAPLATEIAAPDDEPPGTRGVTGVARIGRRAVVRVDADARKGELRHVGAADQGAARGAQPRHGGAHRPGGRVHGPGPRSRRASAGPSMSNRSLAEKARPARRSCRVRRRGRLPGLVEHGAGEGVRAGRGLARCSDGVLHFGACIGATCQKVEAGGVKVRLHGGAEAARSSGQGGGAAAVLYSLGFASGSYGFPHPRRNTSANQPNQGVVTPSEKSTKRAGF